MAPATWLPGLYGGGGGNATTGCAGGGAMYAGGAVEGVALLILAA